MFAIIEIGGSQYKVIEGNFLYVPFIKKSEGEKISFNVICYLKKDGSYIIGDPIIKDAYVKIKVIKHLKGKKVIIFKKKRRKGYKIKKGYRQKISKLEVISISN